MCMFALGSLTACFPRIPNVVGMEFHDDGTPKPELLGALRFPPLALPIELDTEISESSWMELNNYYAMAVFCVLVIVTMSLCF